MTQIILLYHICTRVSIRIASNKHIMEHDITLENILNWKENRNDNETVIS